MKMRTRADRILLFSGMLLTFAPLLRAEAQDVDVPGNLTMHDSLDPTVGNVLKEGVPFLHNFGTNNTFLGSGAGNFTMSGSSNTASGFNALSSNTTGGGNTASGFNALSFNSTGSYNTASGVGALVNNTTGIHNTATGVGTLASNTIGDNNTAIGFFADVATGNLTNATAIGWRAVVNGSNKIRLGDTNVTVIEGEVPYTYTSDRNEKENFRSVDTEAVLTKLRGLSVTSWNYKGQDAKQFRHYGPVAQDFFAAFGHDAVGTIGTPPTITSGDLDGILMIAVQALEKRTDELKCENAQLKAKLEILEQGLGTSAVTTTQ